MNFYAITEESKRSTIAEAPIGFAHSRVHSFVFVLMAL